VFEVASTVSFLARQLPVTFEIKTQDYWLRQEEGRYEGLYGVKISAARQTIEDYHRWLREADILVVPYNFDEESVRYLRYSFANKIPECLASGAAVLAYGPPQISTIAELARSGVVELVLERNLDALRTAIAALVTDVQHRTKLAEAARAHAFMKHSLEPQVRAFRQSMLLAASSGATPGVTVTQRSRSYSSRPADRVFLLGNGPSLKGFDFSQLAGYDTIGMNAAYRHWDKIGFRPTYYCCLDTVVGLSHQDAIERLARDPNGPRKLLVRDNLYAKMSAPRPHVQNFEWIREAFPILRAEPLTTGSHAALWAALMGYREIVILGVDASYVEELPTAKTVQGLVREVVATGRNPNYYFEDYQQIGDRFHKPNAEPGVHVNAWRAAAALLQERGVRVWNASPRSKLDLFRKKPIESFVQSAPRRVGTSVPQTRAGLLDDGLTDDHRSPLIVIYTMGKVGSTTISHSLHRAGIPCLDVHFLNPARLQLYMQDNLRRGGSLPRHFGESIIHNFIRQKWPRRRILYITLVREPVARNLSAVFQNLSKQTPPTVEEIQSEIRKYPVRLPDQWFADELFATTGLNYGSVMLREGAMHSIVKRNRFSLLTLKLGIGDLEAGEIVSDFVQAKVKIKRINEAPTKWYAELYQTVVSERLFDDEFVRGSLANRYVEWFWSEDERTALRARYGV
jgi:hypothetical protein